MHYLKIKRSKGFIRSDGSSYAVPLSIKKTKKFGKVIEEKSLSRKKSLVITGGHDSGKSYWVSRLYREHPAIWSKFPDPALYLDAIRPVVSWSDSPAIVNWWLNKQKKDTTLPCWSKLKAYERQEKISAYFLENKSLLFIDNAHKLSGRKLQIAKECLISSKISIIATTDEERLSPSIRHLILRRNPQIIRLGTETAYDATQILIYFFALAALGAGWWELTLVLGGLTAISKSNRSAKQD